MSLIAPRIEGIKQSPSQAATQRARELKAAGEDIISMSVGEPNFPTPDHVCEAAIAAMRRGDTRYTNVDGTPELKRAIIDKFKRENGLEYTPDQIIAGNGAKQILFNIFMCSLSPGDEVILPAPYWVSYPDMVKIAEGVPVTLACEERFGFKLQAAQLDAAITPRTKWLLINSPCNPSGVTYSREELKSLTDVLLRHPQVHLIMDDVYEHILFDRRAFCTAMQIEPNLRDRILTVNGVSKAYAMTGWRIGYAGGPQPLIKAMMKFQGQSTSSPCSISQAAAVAALNGPQDFIPERSAAFQERRDRALKLLSQAPGIRCHKPEGAFYLYPNCEGLIGKTRPDGRVLKSDGDVAIYLLEEVGVAVVPGAAFGLSPYFRLSLATSMELLEEACKRIVTACGRTNPN
ncbi:MAG: pyridoxal phosphate-dependent aminotransferase [Deltaproteobacteria bacterium]|nr:pyridoxal phosphate-dependent aminotransferase [Deltaproteobacteria bacterium]